MFALIIKQKYDKFCVLLIIINLLNCIIFFKCRKRLYNFTFIIFIWVFIYILFYLWNVLLFVILLLSLLIH